jgi:hypothetical protein
MYYLRSHIYFCRSTNYYVFLDSERDTYATIRSRDFSRLGPWLDGWDDPSSKEICSTPELSKGVIELAEQLTARAIISDHPGATKRASRLHLQTASTTVIRAQSHLPLKHHLASMLVACGLADRLLRRTHITSIIQRVVKRKRQQYTQQPDPRRANELACCFNRQRLLYPREYLCLFDSLALVEFMAIHGVYPNWVFGVVAEPFQAHCWVQANDVLLNDTLERTAMYSPIMAI